MDNEKQKFIQHLNESIVDNSFIKITLGKYRGGDKEFENVFITRIETKDGEKISFKFRYKTKDIVKNYDPCKGIKLAEEIIGKDFFSATLFTTGNDFTLDYSKKRVPQLHTKKPTHTSSEISQHNRVKPRFVNQDAKYFKSLGITTSDGKVKADMYDKFRQVDKFIEIVDSLYRSSGLKEKEEIKIIDMGSGKSYITFAMYDYFSNQTGKKVNVKGIEQREDLVKLCNRISGDCRFNGLKFELGTIESSKEEKPDIVVALHACDTATDDAIIKGLKSEAAIIVLAPCCQKYLRKKIRSPEIMKGIYKHGIHEERLSVMLTDGLRALVMEHFGYDTKVFEFISSEHTAKNTMITAVKKDTPLKRSDEKLNEINIIKKEFQIEDFYLDKDLFNPGTQSYKED
ncbi:MAG: SAM-dependent methyltransferase [Bacteroidota bacterium]|nr:SAM-dependent methyltransferase [Bacteroidota bacterium]